jgi:hypothetical protein
VFSMFDCMRSWCLKISCLNALDIQLLRDNFFVDLARHELFSMRISKRIIPMNSSICECCRAKCYAAMRHIIPINPTGEFILLWVQMNFS